VGLGGVRGAGRTVLPFGKHFLFPAEPVFQKGEGYAPSGPNFRPGPFFRSQERSAHLLFRSSYELGTEMETSGDCALSKPFTSTLVTT